MTAPRSELSLKYSFEPLSEAEGKAVNAAVAAAEPMLAHFTHLYIAHSQQALLGRSSAPTARDLQEMASLQDLFPPRAFRSHRPVVGPLIILGKRILVGLAYKILKFGLGRQVELNQHHWNLALSVHLLDQRVEQLEKLILQKRET